MKPGDLVQIKEFYRNQFDENTYSIITEIFEDDDGFFWYKVASPSYTPITQASHWHPDYQLEVLSEL